ncbi:hypothetical protein P879_08319 [Paragonimus westermani]|uniref:Peptidase C1A papain C-terminal domain-containing protein n=1 Tax=Paragonimus westermani TaxID=34504 RepID=A0A8T0D962_9TREM|nr:hypothetical protein P879_08319 [Paragonimus westermani]
MRGSLAITLLLLGLVSECHVLEKNRNGKAPSEFQVLPTIYHNIDDEELPKSFDAREKWPECPTIGKIGDSGECGHDWAISASSTMSDRLCIHSDGRYTVALSAYDLRSTCPKCADELGTNGMAWVHWKTHGLVTGGLYDERTGCQPYPCHKCSHRGRGSYPPCHPGGKPDYEWSEECRPGYNISYAEDKHFGKNVYRLMNDQKQIMKEIMINGPVETMFALLTDFLDYQSGVYYHQRGYMIGYYPARIIGWGEDEQGTPYWLLANSVNEQWGENGFFRMRRGNNECGVEQFVVAGLPRV